MKYPEELYRQGRPILDKSEISKKEFLYARHKPGHDWKIDENIPDYTKIKIDPDNQDENQSYNWDKLSKHHWVRFNPLKEYLINYAVVGYLADTIRNIEKYCFENNGVTAVSKGTLDVEHKPTEINYSHCQLLCTDKFKESNVSKRIKKRAMRMGMRHNSHVFLMPNSDELL